MFNSRFQYHIIMAYIALGYALGSFADWAASIERTGKHAVSKRTHIDTHNRSRAGVHMECAWLARMSHMAKHTGEVAAYAARHGLTNGVTASA